MVPSCSVLLAYRNSATIMHEPRCTHCPQQRGRIYPPVLLTADHFSHYILWAYWSNTCFQISRLPCSSVTREERVRRVVSIRAATLAVRASYFANFVQVCLEISLARLKLRQEVFKLSDDPCNHQHRGFEDFVVGSDDSLRSHPF